MKWLKIGLYLFAIFVIFEILFRLTNPMGIGYYHRAYKYLQSCRDTGMGYYINGTDGGLRSDVGDKEKKRILLLGDSIVYGLGVKKEDTFAEILNRELPDYEFINAGVGGWNTDNESLWLMNEGYYLEPDVVILYITNNDLENVYAGKKPKYPLYQKVIYNSYVLSTVFYIKRNVFKALFGRTSFKSNVTPDAKEIAEIALTNIIALSPKLIACVYGSRECRETDTLQFYLNLLKANKIPTFFLPENFYSDKYRISTIDHHPNEAGHEYIADATKQVIQQLEKLNQF